MAFTERYVRSDAAGGGDGTTDTNSGANGALTWAEMLAYGGTVALAGIRFNVKAGTYSRTTSADAFTVTAGAATVANPCSIQGFNSSVGDLETNGRTQGGALVTTNFPAITYTTGNLTIPAFCVAAMVDITSAISGNTTSVPTTTMIRKAKIANTHATSASARAVNAGGGIFAMIDNCDLSVASSNAGTSALSAADMYVTRCLMTAGSGSGCVILANGGPLVMVGCTFRDAGFGVSAPSANSMAIIESCSYRNIAGNYNNQGSTSAPMQIANCVAWGSGGSSAWYNSTTSVRAHYQTNNAVGNMGGADVNEGNWPVIGEVALTSDPFTSSSDLTLNSTAGGGTACKGVGLFPYLDIGAWQVQAATGSILVHPGMSGGMRG